MNQYSCKGCGTGLTVLNMSEDEDYCKACFDKIVASIDTEDESIETKWMPDGIWMRYSHHRVPKHMSCISIGCGDSGGTNLWAADEKSNVINVGSRCTSTTNSIPNM